MIKALSKFRIILVSSSTVGLIIVAIILFVLGRNGGLARFFDQMSFVPNVWSSLGLNESGTGEQKEGYIKQNSSKASVLKPTAQAYLAADLGTGEILVEKNKDKVFPIASISKIMTALVTVE